VPREVNTLAFIATLLVSGGVLGALVGAYVQRKVDRERLMTEWKRNLRERILGPKLDAARDVYETLISGGVPGIEEAEKLCPNQAEILLTELAPSAAEPIRSLPHRLMQYASDRDSVRTWSQMAFGDEDRLDGWFRGETFRGTGYYRTELAVVRDHSQARRDALVAERAGLDLEAKEPYKKLEVYLCAALEIRHELISSLQKFITSLKGALLGTH
jgi:hypothetical protein